VTHINHYKELLKSKVAADAPKIVIEWIFPKTTSRFDGSIKTDVLGFWECKFEAKEVNRTRKSSSNVLETISTFTFHLNLRKTQKAFYAKPSLLVL
jgi:hypothetical protein